MSNGKRIIAGALCIASMLAMSGMTNAAEIAGKTTPTPGTPSGIVAPIFVAKGGQKPGSPAAGTTVPTAKTPDVQSNITTKVGRTFGVQLVCDKSGYAWKVVSISNKKVAKFTGSRFSVSTTVSGRNIRSKDQKPVKISTKVEDMNFKALAKGTAEIKLAYVGSKSVSSKSDRTATIKVTVR